MKVLMVLLFFFTSVFLFGQENLNQKTEKGQKTGEWVELYDNGKVKSVTYFEPTERKLSRTDLFTLGIDKADTVIFEYAEKLLLIEYYEYNENGDFKRIKRMKPSEEAIYLYGHNQEIELSTSDLDVANRVNEITFVSYELTNHSNQPIILIPAFSAKNLKSDSKIILLPPNKNTTFTTHVTIEPNDNNYEITLKNTNVTIDLILKTFGYDITSKDVENGLPLAIKNRFIYYRTGSEALLKVYTIDKKKELKTVPLSKQKTRVNLKDIPPGDYWLETINYSLNKRILCKLRIES